MCNKVNFCIINSCEKYYHLHLYV
uniref:Uncharacterized protein n=1 Tax=Arundo donax TaxID=35708 RepID=A0A0A9C961_ARUDO